MYFKANCLRHSGAPPQPHAPLELISESVHELSLNSIKGLSWDDPC